MKIILPCSFTLLTSDTTCLTPIPGYAPAGHYGFLTDRYSKDGQLHLTYTTHVAGTLCTEVASFCTELQYLVLRMCMGVLRGLRRRCPGWPTLLVLVMLLWWFCERGDYAQLPPITVSPYTDAKLLNPMGLSKCLASSGQGSYKGILVVYVGLRWFVQASHNTHVQEHEIIAYTGKPGFDCPYGYNV